MFGRMFRGATFAELLEKADALFEREAWMEARMAYLKALDRAKPGDAESAAAVKANIATCLDEMALGRIAEAGRLVETEQEDLAVQELQSALETAASDAVRDKAREALHRLEEAEALDLAAAPEAMSDDDRFAMLAGGWSEAQLAEYDDYGEPFREAALALADGHAARARPALERIAESAEQPLYLWLDLGAARLADGDRAGATEAYRAFLTGAEGPDTAEARLLTHLELAAVAELEGDEEAAIAELERGMTALPDDPRPFLALGRYLRIKGHADDALEVLNSSLDLYPDGPSWQVLQELGLAEHARGQAQKAQAYLERVIAHFVEIRRLDFPPESASTLATLFEQQGRLEKAADLYANLARGSDRQNRIHYHQQAARLLDRMNSGDRFIN